MNYNELKLSKNNLHFHYLPDEYDIDDLFSSFKRCARLKEHETSIQKLDNNIDICVIGRFGMRMKRDVQFPHSKYISPTSKDLRVEGKF